MYIPEKLLEDMLPIINRIQMEHTKDTRLKAKMHFQKDNILLNTWLTNVFTQGLLDGDKGLESTVYSIVEEQDQIIQVCKFLYAYQIWGFFKDANAAEVSSDLILQGHTRNSLNKIVRMVLFNEINENITKSPLEEYEEYDLEQDTNDNYVGPQPTFH